MRHPYAKMQEVWTLTSRHADSINSEWVTHLNIRAETIKLPEGNLRDLSLGKEFSDVTPKDKNG